jgi:hypothetical protein
MRWWLRWTPAASLAPDRQPRQRSPSSTQPSTPRKRLALRSISSWLANNKPGYLDRHGTEQQSRAGDVEGGFGDRCHLPVDHGVAADDVERVEVTVADDQGGLCGDRRGQSCSGSAGARAIKFEQGYAQRRPLVKDAVSWYEALHAVRILTRVRA